MRHPSSNADAPATTAESAVLEIKGGVLAGKYRAAQVAMGITGLLPFLKEVQREVNVSSFRGRKVAVDAYCWLHKGSYSCAMQLVMKSEKLESL